MAIDGKCLKRTSRRSEKNFRQYGISFVSMQLGAMAGKSTRPARQRIGG
jgi:hypothetical protein